MLNGVRDAIIHDGMIHSILIRIPSGFIIPTRQLILRILADLHIFTLKRTGITWIYRTCILPVSPVPSFHATNGVHPE